MEYSSAKDVYVRSKREEIGFKNISVDLIYSLPNQTIDDLATLITAFPLELEHYSAYSLIIEPKTVFYNLMKKENYRLPAEDIEADNV